MPINGNQWRPIAINRNQWRNIELSISATVLPFNASGAHGGLVCPRRRANFRCPRRAVRLPLTALAVWSPPVATCLFDDRSPGVATCPFSFILSIIDSLPLLPYCRSAEFELDPA